ncbi:MAG TPA: aminotransferase class V-fold PLP-dependent enzyme [Candidatus Saccharimonadales bacterium]|nr:aminotransferase class V-fold PLP-dependent enzyme [Candidatus Saccharimonadales bacterium]
MVAPEIPGTDRLAAVRAALPALAAGIYLNTGSVGPMPAETAAAMTELERYELTTGRSHPDYFLELVQRMAEARAAVAAILVADADDIALTHATSDGMNIGIWSVDWRPGDRAVTTRLEHPGGTGALHHLRNRLGIEVDFVDVGIGGDRGVVIDAFDAAIDHRTRVVALSHVLWATGAVLPVAEIAELAHARGAIVVVDGAQSAGAMPVDVNATGADVYAIPAQKWLLGPEGMGAIAVARAVRDRLQPAFGGHFGFEAVDPAGSARQWTAARRFEHSNFHRPSVVGMARSIGWLGMFVGLDWVYGRGAALARWTADRLAGIPGVEVVTPRDAMAGLITFRIAGWEAQAALDELGARVFAVARTIPFLDAVRISVGAFNSEDELQRFAEAVELLAAHTPDRLPPRRSLTLLADA